MHALMKYACMLAARQLASLLDMQMHVARWTLDVTFVTYPAIRGSIARALRLLNLCSVNLIEQRQPE